MTLPDLQQRYSLVTQVRVDVSDSHVTLPAPMQLATCEPPPPPPACESPIRFFRDADADGFGDSSSSVMACTAPPSFTLIGFDCNDSNHRVSPDSSEILNGIDDDCDGAIDEGLSPQPDLVSLTLIDPNHAPQARGESW